MGSKRKGVPALPAIRAKVKPTTQLQAEFSSQQDVNLQHAQKTTPAIRAFLMQERKSGGIPPIPDANFHPDEDLPNIDGDDNPSPPAMDLDQLLPPQPDDIDSILEAMAEARYQESRLKNKKRWETQVGLMLPVFLRCCLRTSDWGNPKLCHHDYKANCECPKAKIRVRAVDLVDSDSRCSFGFLP